MDIYCIHEPNEKYEQRLEQINTLFSKISEDYNLVWITSHPASSFADDSPSIYNKSHLSGKPSEKSCFWKHYDAIKAIVNNGQTGLVIEDDVIFKSNLLRKCNKLIKTNGLEEPYYINIEYSSYDVPIWYLFKSLVKMNGTKRCGGYIVSPKAAELICSFIENRMDSGNAIREPSDAFITNNYSQIGINTYWAVHPLVWQGSKTGRYVSELSGREYHAHFKLYESTLFYCMPIVNKLRACFRKKILDRIQSVL